VLEDEMKVWGWVLALGLAVLAGCSSAPAPVPVVGTPAGLQQLAGEWGGEYRGETTGRSGSIIFRLTAASDTAYGDVVMIRATRTTGTLSASPSVGLPMPPAPEVLSIAFVRAENGGVTGQLKPYRDPDCDCQLATTFEGQIKGDVIEGTYRSVRINGNPTPQTGTWRVTRKKS
jgi:hypothetical protein